MTQSWFVGLDCGGSKTELLAASAQTDEEVLLTGPSVHAQRMSISEMTDVLHKLIRQFLGRTFKGDLGAVCVGIAGAGRPREQRRLASALQAALGPDAPPHLRVVHDGEIALEAALEGESGAITISGTGSLVLARTQAGDFERAGGWGYQVGDDGSGLTLGRRGLHAVATDYDGGPSTRLRALLAQQHDVHSILDLIDLAHRESWPIQQMAPLVIEGAQTGDDIAQHLLDEETHRLIQQVRWIADRSNIAISPQLAPLGGLTKETTYMKAYRHAVEDILPGWSLCNPAHNPVVGALNMAQTMAKVSSLPK